MGIWTEAQTDKLKEWFNDAYEHDFDLQIVTDDDFELPQNFDDIDWSKVKSIRITRHERETQGEPKVNGT